MQEKSLSSPARRVPSPIGSEQTADGTSLSKAARGRPIMVDQPRADGKVELTERSGWSILCVIFAVQCSMNANASLYANGVGGISEHFGVSEQAARVGQAIFLIAYGFGCELWAAPSEELGRWPILQASLFLVNVFQLPCALAQNFHTVIIGRFFGGLSSAGGSVTLGMVADMWEPDEQQYAVCFVVLSSVGGAVIGPIIGGFIQAFLHWRWVFWIQLIFGGAVQIAHFFLVPETRSTVMLDREARRRRKTGEDPNCYGHRELKPHRFDSKEVLTIMLRPFVMFAKEPIVLCLSLLSGFSDMLIFVFLDATAPLYAKWSFSVQMTGLSFVVLAAAYLIAYGIHLIDIRRQVKLRRANPNRPPEDRMRILQYIVPLLPLGLLGFAATSLGPAWGVPWIAPMLVTAGIGLANFSIYLTTIDYMVAAYGPYAASACGGNGMARDVLAGAAAMYATPFYHNIGTGTDFQLFWPSLILAIIGIVVAIPVYVFVQHGAYFRERSYFAQTIAAERQINNEYNPGKKRNVQVQHVEEALPSS